MGTGKRRCHLFVYRTVGLAPTLIHADNRFADTQPTLITGRVAAAAVQRSGSAGFIEAAVRIVAHHGVAGFRADTVALRHENRLVVITAKGGGLVLLPDGSLAAALAPRTDLQGERWRILCAIHDQGNVPAACTAPTGQRLHHTVLGNLHPAVGRMIFQCNGGRHNAGPEGGRPFFLVPDASGIGRVFRAEAGRFEDTGLMPMLLCAERPGHFFGHIHLRPALVVQADSSAAACRSSAVFRTGGSSLPRTEALRRIPRQAVGLK